MSIVIPTRLKFLRKRFKDRKFTLLDVGCGSSSASQTLQWFPLCEYHGIDRTTDYNNTSKDFEVMRRFYQLDLTSSSCHEIPERYFDVVIMSHVIEHLENGDEVVRRLIPKLKNHGVIYIESPGRRSLNLPSKKGTLNFFDDPTHCRFYPIDELQGLLRECKCEILDSGVRRDLTRILMMPLFLISSKLKLGYVTGSVFWDFLGFADYVIARKL